MIGIAIMVWVSAPPKKYLGPFGLVVQYPVELKVNLWDSIGTRMPQKG